MALKIEGVTLYGKTDVHKFNPLELVGRFAPFTGRVERSEEQINKMVNSLLLVGQEQAITYRMGFDGGPIPVTGHTRILAAARITERGMKGASGEQYNLEHPFIIRGEYRKMNEMQAVLHTFAENDPESRTPINHRDTAALIDTLSKNWGVSDADIAAHLGKDVAWVTKHHEILLLDPETQRKIATGEIAWDTGITTVAAIAPAERAAVLAKAKKTKTGKATATAIAQAARDLGIDFTAMTPEVRAQIVAKAKKDKGKITTASVTNAARELGVSLTAKPLKNSDATFNKWVKETVDNTAPGPAKNFLFAVLDFRAGTITKEELDKSFLALDAAAASAVAA